MFRRIAYGSNLGNFWHVVQQIGKTIVQSCQRMIFLPTKSFHDKPNVTVNRRIYRCSRGRLGLAVKKGTCHLQQTRDFKAYTSSPPWWKVMRPPSSKTGFKTLQATTLRPTFPPTVFRTDPCFQPTDNVFSRRTTQIAK